MLVSEEAALNGTASISVETQQGMVPGEADLPTYIGDHFPEFVRNLRYLPKEDQDMLLCYYVLGKTQAQIAEHHSTTQTLRKSDIRKSDIRKSDKERVTDEERVTEERVTDGKFT